MLECSVIDSLPRALAPFYEGKWSRKSFGSFLFRDLDESMIHSDSSDNESSEEYFVGTSDFTDE